MNTTTPTMCCKTASADDGDDPGESSSEPDQPPERAEPSGAGDSTAAGAVEVVGPESGFGATLDLGWLSEQLRAALNHVDRPIERITVTVVDDSKMLALNEAHRRVDDTTDVLSFEHSGSDGPIEADIVVCADEAARRAAELGHSIERELLLYALHGVLHCAGFDDQTNEDFEAMHAEEDRILAAIGVGPTFARGWSGHDGDPHGEGP